jgi:hypothetical protein
MFSKTPSFMYLENRRSLPDAGTVSLRVQVRDWAKLTGNRSSGRVTRLGVSLPGRSVQ